MRYFITFVLVLISYVSFGQIVGTQVLAFKGNITSTIRDGLDVPTGEYWLIYNTTTSQLESSDDTDTWAAFSGAIPVATDITIADAGGIITGTNVETALQENRTAIDLNTAKVTNATHTGEVTGSGALTIASGVVDSDNIVNGTIDETDLDASVNASLDLADTSIQNNSTNNVTGTLNITDNTDGGGIIINSSTEQLTLKGGDTGTPSNVEIVLGPNSITIAGYTEAEQAAAGDNSLVTKGYVDAAAGTSLPVSDATSIVEGSSDATKEVRIEADGITTGTVRVITMPDADVNLGLMVENTIAGRTGTAVDAIMIQTKAQRDSDGAAATDEIVFCSDCDPMETATAATLVTDSYRGYDDRATDAATFTFSGLKDGAVVMIEIDRASDATYSGITPVDDPDDVGFQANTEQLVTILVLPSGRALRSYKNLE